MMNAYLCGAWDGANLWVQWEDVAPEAGYRLRFRLRKSASEIWPEQWRSVGGPETLRKAWLVLPTWREGFEAQVQVAVATALPVDLVWFAAQEVLFVNSTARFEITSEVHRVLYPKGAEFIAAVDGGVCAYRLPEAVEVVPGGRVEVEMIAVLPGPWHQLDHADHFLIRPALGLTIRNLAPSENDVALTGRGDSTLIRKNLSTVGPLRIAFGPGNAFRGAN